ncbi:tRNA lysidine(34) synthetase TilS [Ruminococcus sp.]|uniref:tRNA lysidine(34) synthetase TilS n=1 Tax=Ruminococcus sp. TaxID=41978 RepID=UPI003864DF4C
MSNPFLKAVDTYCLIEYNDKIAVALSGGADSVSLLHMLCSVKEKYNLTLFAIHINHMIRGAEAERDESFCREFCKRLGIELFLKRVDVPALAKNERISTELCGRNVRYSAFEEISKKLDCKIATAHTLSDNAETLMINLVRGTSLNGLCAIPARRGNIIRPLILCDRAYIENYCKENSLDFVTDSTNLTDDYTRNKIRHNVITELKSINPSFETSVKRLCDDARLVVEYLDKQTKLALSACKLEYGYSTDKLLSFDKIIRQNAIKQICLDSGAEIPEHIHIELIDDIFKNGGSVDLNGNFRAIAKQGILRVEQIKFDNNTTDEISFSNVIDKEFILAGQKYLVKEVTNSDCQGDNYISLSENEISKAVIRTRRQGDKFFFEKRKLLKSLRKAMNEFKIPSEQRDLIPLVALDDKILWCKGINTTQTSYSAEKRKFIIM